MRRTVLVYALVIGVSVAAIAGLLHLGDSWYAPLDAGPGVADPARYAPQPSYPLAVLIVQLLVIVVAAQVFGALARLVRQPAVIGEIAAGLLLGPSLLGHLWPAAFGFLFPDSSLDVLRLMSQVGVILFMFTVGLDLDLAHLQRSQPVEIGISRAVRVLLFSARTNQSPPFDVNVSPLKGKNLPPTTGSIEEGGDGQSAFDARDDERLSEPRSTCGGEFLTDVVTGGSFDDF